jgi:hypothetical protein
LIPVIAELIIEYITYTTCPHCLNHFECEDNPRIHVPYGGCDHLIHQQCLHDMIARAANRSESHLLCKICKSLLWIDEVLATSGVSINRTHVEDILYNGKCIENRSQKWSPGYYWLRTTKEKGNRRVPPGHIMGLIHLGEDHDEYYPSEEQWVLEEYSYHFPLRLIWTFPSPLEWTPPPGAQSRFRVNEDLLHRLIRF